MVEFKITFECWKKPVSKKNKMKFNRRHGRAYKDPSVREFEEWLHEEALQEKRKWEQLTCYEWKQDQKYKLSVVVVAGTRRRFDIQNVFDTICDSLQGVFYEDDSQIVEISGKKTYEQGAKDRFSIYIEIV